MAADGGRRVTSRRPHGVLNNSCRRARIIGDTRLLAVQRFRAAEAFSRARARRPASRRLGSRRGFMRPTLETIPRLSRRENRSNPSALAARANGGMRKARKTEIERWGEEEGGGRGRTREERVLSPAAAWSGFYPCIRASGRRMTTTTTTTTTPAVPPSPRVTLLLCLALAIRVDGLVNLIGIAFHLLSICRALVFAL